MPSDEVDYAAKKIETLRNNTREGVRPVTIRQLVNATRLHSSAPFRIDGIEVHEITTVAHVVDIRRYKTVTLLVLEDGTEGGWITAKRWLYGGDTDGLPTDEQDFYVHIMGELFRAPEELKNGINIRGLHVVTDPHQLLLHILETAFVTLALERGPPTDSVKRSVGSRAQALGHHQEDQVWPPGAPATPAVERVMRSRHTAFGPMQVPLSPGGRSPPPSPSPSPRPRTSVPASPSRGGEHTSLMSSKSNSPTPLRQESRRVPPLVTLRRDPDSNLSVLERAILLQVLSASSGASENGVSVVTITRGVSHHHSTAAEISAALDVLVDKGLIRVLDDGIHYVDAAKGGHYPTLP